MYAGPTTAITGSVLNKSSSETRNFALFTSFVYPRKLSLPGKLSLPRKHDGKKQFRIHNAVGNMLIRKFSFAPIDANIQLFKTYCYLIYLCALWRHSYHYAIRKLTVNYSDTFKRLLMCPDTPARVWYLR